MNVKAKALTVVSGLILGLSGFSVLYGIRLHNEQIQDTILAEERTIDATVRDIERLSLALYQSRLANMVEEHPELVRAFAARDRERLYALSLPLFQRRQRENRFLHAWDFNLPDGTVFLRVQDPGAHGDDIGRTREMIQAVHERREAVAGFDVGRHGALYWVARPVSHEGTYVGATELGVSVDQLREALESRFETQVALTVRAAGWRKATLAGGGNRQYGDETLVASDDSRFARVPDEALFATADDRRVSIDGGDYVLHSCAVLHDYRGRPVGTLKVLQDITERLAHRREFIVGAALSSGLLLSLSFAVLYASFGTLIGRLENYAAENKQAREQIEKANDELELHVRQRTAELQGANHTLDEQRRFLGTVLESLTHPFYVVDVANYRILLANKAANPEGRPMAGLTCHALTHGRAAPCSGEEHPCALQEVTRTERPAVLEHVHGVGGGATRIFQIYAYPVFDDDGAVAQVIEYCVDVTAAREAANARAGLERQLRQAQKMEAIGALAGGIAHDFNNILAAIFGHADLIRYALPPGSKHLPDVEGILRAGSRARDLVHQILAFSRQGEEERRPLLAAPVIKEALKLLRASLPATVEIRESIQPCSPILSDPTQVHQIVMNLCTNAFHALRGKEAGVIGVSLSPLAIGEEDRRAEFGLLVPGRYVKLEVSDTGCGMDGATLERIFDPYFTTKPKGEGTGLGLAVVHGIVKSHGGHVSVYSEPGVGTTFKVYFPECEPPPDRRGLVGPDDIIPAVEPLPGGSERILLVDDEPQLVEVVRAMLGSLGYRVEAHTDAEAALRAFTRDPQAHDLLLTDMTMPGMTGAQLACRVLELRPGFPIVLSTGFSEIMDGERARKIGVREFIMKPILKADLAAAVRRALARG